MKLKKLFLSVLSIMIMGLSGSATVVSATSTEPNTSVTIEANLSNSDYQKTVQQLFEDPNILEVNIIDTSLVNSSYVPETPEIVPYSYTYYVASGKKKEAGTYTGSKVLAKAQGGPGVTLSISQTKGVSNTYSCSLPVRVSSVSSTVGFNVTTSESITISGSATVPSKYNNKNVKTMTLSAYPLYQKYTYSVSKVISKNGLTLRQQNVGTGSASKAIGCTFKRAYSYK